MKTLILRTIKDRWKILLAVSAIGFGTMLMYISMFPMYQDMMAENEQIFDQMPEAMKKAFNMDEVTFDTLEKFLNIEMYSLFWIILTIILCLSLAGSSLAADVERETVIQSSAQPISRSRIYFGRWVAAAAIFTVFNVLVNASAIPLATAFNISYHAENFLTVGVMCELFGLGLLGLGFGVSAWLSDKGKVYMILAGAVLIMYVLNIISAINLNLENLKYASIFHYFDSFKFLVRNEYSWQSILVFGGLMVAGTLAGWWRWTKRDLV